MTEMNLYECEVIGATERQARLVLTALEDYYPDLSFRVRQNGTMWVVLMTKKTNVANAGQVISWARGFLACLKRHVSI